jgi:hypothetical protein
MKRVLTLSSFIFSASVKSLRNRHETSIKRDSSFYSVVIFISTFLFICQFPVMRVAPVTLELTAVSTALFYQITITINQSISHHAGRHQVIIMSNREADWPCINVHIWLCLNGTMPSPCAYCSVVESEEFSSHRTTKLHINKEA